MHFQIVGMRRPPHPRPILFWLRLLVILGVLPAWAATAVAIKASYDRERATIESTTLELTRDVMDAVDRELAIGIAGLQALATSPHLTVGNFAAFHGQAREVLSTQTGNGIGLSEPTGQLILSTLRPYGEKLSLSRNLDFLRVVSERAKPAISDFYIGATSGRPQVAVGVPVIRDGKVIYDLVMGILPDHLDEVLHAERLPAEWVAAIFDKNGTIVARTQAADKFVGRKGSPALLSQIAAAPGGGVEAGDMDGTPVLASFSRSDLSGWAVAISIPTAGLTADLLRRLWLSAAGAGVVFLIALFLARQISLRIARPMRVLSEAALSLASDAPIAVPQTAIKEADEVGRALARTTQLLKERTVARDEAQAQARAHQDELARFSRISLVGEMAAGIVHELSQPLTAIAAYGRGCLRLLAQPAPDAEMLKEGATEMVQQAERAADVVSRLRDFISQNPSRQGFVAPRLLIDAAIGLAASEVVHNGVEIAVRADPNLPLVFADNIQIEQVLLNLLLNAIDAMVDGAATQRRIVVAAKRKGAGHVEISVADSGPGISPEVRDRIFEPFVTTKPRGMGMGLSISRTIVEGHGGKLLVVPRQATGATIAFDLPTIGEERDSNAA